MRVYKDSTEYLFQYEAVKIGVLDALTLSYDGSQDYEVNQSLRYVVNTLMKRGNRPRPWTTANYKGYRVGPLRFGINRQIEHNCLAMITGELTSCFAWEVIEPTRVTRIDFAIDVIAQQKDYTVRDMLEKWKVEYTSEDSNPYEAGFYYSRDGGMTATKGKRGGRLYTRIYDKGAERGLSPNFWWRFEVEIKDRKAMAGYNQYMEAEDKTKFCIATVETILERQGLPTPILVGREYEPNLITAVKANDDGVARKMVFLRKTVKPFLHNLTNYVTVEEILNIINL